MRFAVLAALVFLLSSGLAAGGAQGKAAHGAPAAPQAKADHGAPAAGARETMPQAIADARRAGRKILLIDVRDPAEYATGHAEDAINIPLPRLRRRIEELEVPKTTEIVTMCASGNRSSRAAVLLAGMGYKTATYCPLKKWEQAGLKIERTPQAPRGKRPLPAKSKPQINDRRIG